MSFSKQPVKGMSDFDTNDMRVRNAVLAQIKEAYSFFGFMQIETPMLEHIENLLSKQGGDNEKLIFKVLKRGAALDRAWESGNRDELVDSGLRYDLTVPLARFYANNKEKLSMPFRALQIGPVWRADQPAKGRFRQFVQCDIDVIGDASNVAEIELVTATSLALNRVLSGNHPRKITIYINDRRLLFAVARKAGFAESEIPSLLITLDKLDKIGAEGVSRELAASGVDEDKIKAFLSLFAHDDAAGGAKATKTATQFCKDADIYDDEQTKKVADNLDEIISVTQQLIHDQSRIQFKPSLVRGMAYYTGPIFEVSVDDLDISVAGGGRYDEMIGKFSGDAVCACGFSIGFERIVTLLQNEEIASFTRSQEAVVFLLDKKLPQSKRLEALKKAQSMRDAGCRVAVVPMRKNLGRQIQMFENEGFTQFEKIYAD